MDTPSEPCGRRIVQSYQTFTFLEMEEDDSGISEVRNSYGLHQRFGYDLHGKLARPVAKPHLGHAAVHGDVALHVVGDFLLTVPHPLLPLQLAPPDEVPLPGPGLGRPHHSLAAGHRLELGPGVRCPLQRGCHGMLLSLLPWHALGAREAVHDGVHGGGRNGVLHPLRCLQHILQVRIGLAGPGLAGLSAADQRQDVRFRIVRLTNQVLRDLGFPSEYSMY